MEENKDIDYVKVKAMNKSQIAALYGVCTKTLSKWLRPFTSQVGEMQNTYIFTPDQVKIIFEKLGTP